MVLFDRRINLTQNSHTHMYTHKRTFHREEMNFQRKYPGKPEVFKTRLPKIHVIWDLMQFWPASMYQSITSNIPEHLKLYEPSYPVSYNPISFIKKKIELWHLSVSLVCLCPCASTFHSFSLATADPFLYHYRPPKVQTFFLNSYNQEAEYDVHAKHYVRTGIMET